MIIKHFGTPIPLSNEEGMEILKKVFSEIKNNITENETKELEEEIKNINVLQLSHLQG